MRYHLETIPVIDAYQGQSECPMCDLARQTEASYLESFLGASVMEPGVRVQVNQKGFCRPHFEKMLQMRNRLGLALMTHTYLLQTIQALEGADVSKKKRFQKKEKPVAPDTCVLCERLSNTMDRYLRTVLHLWKTNPTFQKRFNQSRGHCLWHHQGLLQRAEKEWPADSARSFSLTLHQLQLQNMKRIEQEIKWFTEKFDYRNADKPFGESKDALERAIRKLRGDGQTGA